jgi:flagellar biosynthesis protein FlhF
MKIKRFFATDIRQAMRMVKEELGADAVIMSNRTVDGGIEIVAARDFDEQSIQDKLQEQSPEQQQPPAHKAKKIVLPNFDAAKKRLQLLDSQRKDGQRKQNAVAFTPEQPVRPYRFPAERDTSAVPGSRSHQLPAERDTPTVPGSRQNADRYVGYAEKIQLREKPEATVSKFNAPPVKEDPLKNINPPAKQASLSDKLLMDMSKELKYLRAAMDTKLANISWVHNSQTTPVRTDLLQRLAGMSISKKLSVMIANHFTDHSDPELVFSKVQEMLAKVLPIAEDNLLETGGIAALVGPTGVGKTTTVAKLAAKFILKHGAKQVALITTDNYRIGAHEQLNIYGRILDVPVRVASSASELRNIINGFSDKRLILIDTAGMSQRDMKLVEQINTLQQNGLSIRSYLVMSAATEYKAMNAIIKAFSVFDPKASILTKLDEAVTIGSAISSIIEHNLPLSFIADGQQVPEDIHSPHARSLIEHCVAELDNAGNDSNDNVDYAPWVAQGYAQAI